MKSFQGRTLEDVLPQIREQLGTEAVVLSQRQVVSGGVGGFFGKRLIEVVAADQMPTDDELIDIENTVAEDGPDALAKRASTASTTPAQTSLPSVPAASPTPQRGGLLDLHDDWNPADDADLAAEFGGVMRAAQAHEAAEPPSTPSPRVRPASDSDYEPLGVPQPHSQDPQHVQAKKLAARAHHAIAAATHEIEQQIAYDRRRPGQRRGDRTFAPVESAPAAKDPLTMLGQQHVQDSIARAQTASTDHADGATTLRAIVTDPEPATDRNDPRFFANVEAMERALFDTGVDTDVVQAVLRQAVSHRLPYSGHADLRRSVRDVVAEHVRVVSGWSPVGRAHRIAFVGPSGAGKSTLIAKIAESYIRECGFTVSVVSILDPTVSFDPASDTDPLRNQTSFDVRYVVGPDQMVLTLERLEDVDVVLFDTPSSAYMQSEVFAHVARCLSAAHIDDVHTVVPLGTSVREAASVIDHFRSLGTNRLSLTKLDESRYVGQILNFGFRFGLPITFLSDGRRVPEDVRIASAHEIANLIVGPPNHA